MTTATLQAPPAAQKEHKKRKRKGAIPPAPQDPDEWSATDADTLRRHLELELAKTTDPKERARLRRVSLETHANPRAFRLTEKVFPSAPTPELVQRMGGRLVAETVIPAAGPVKALNRHRTRSVLEVYAKHLTDELVVFRMAYDDAMAVEAYRGMTMNYGGASGGGRPWEKLGGYANASETAKERAMRFGWIIAHLSRIEQEALHWLILELRSPGMDTLPSISDAGRRWVPSLNHEPTCRGVSIGVLKCLGASLKRLYTIDRGMTRPSDNSSHSSDNPNRR